MGLLSFYYINTLVILKKQWVYLSIILLLNILIVIGFRG